MEWAEEGPPEEKGGSGSTSAWCVRTIWESVDHEFSHNPVVDLLESKHQVTEIR